MNCSVQSVKMMMIIPMIIMIIVIVVADDDYNEDGDADISSTILFILFQQEILVGEGK